MPIDYDPYSPEALENPTELYRNPRRTLSFGTGAHACIGRGFGLLQAEVLTKALLERAPEYVIETEGLEMFRTEYMRGWVNLPARAS